jgi:hypothetical protein
MNYLEALQKLEYGLKITLPEWGGYWYLKKYIINGEDFSYIKVHTKGGEELNTPSVKYMLRNDWEIFKG